MNSMARETPWFDDEAIVPAFGGPAALREAVSWAAVPMCGTGWVASPARRGGMIGASVSGGEIVMCWDAVVQEQGQSVTCTVSMLIELEAAPSDSLSKPWRGHDRPFTGSARLGAAHGLSRLRTGHRALYRCVSLGHRRLGG